MHIMFKIVKQEKVNYSACAWYFIDTFLEIASIHVMQQTVLQREGQ